MREMSSFGPWEAQKRLYKPKKYGRVGISLAVAQPRDPRKMASVEKYAKGRGLFV